MSKIALFSAQYPPHVGGIERYTKCLAMELSKRNHEVYVVTSNIFGYESIQQRDGVTVVNMPCHSFLEGRLPFTKKNAEFKRLEKYLEDIGLDLIIINARFYTHSVFAAKLAYKNNIKCITIDHGSYYIAFNKKSIDWMVHIYEHFMTSRMKKFCKNYYAVSKDSSEWIKTFGITSKGEIQNSIDVNEVQEIIKTETQKDYLSKCKGPIVVYAGRIIERKGILELNEAVFNLSKKYAGIKAVFIGDGELMKQLEDNKYDTTVILGRLPHDETIRLISKSDVFVLASETEGFPTAVLESMACKTFVVTTYAGGSKEIITDENFGQLMKSNEATDIYNAIDKALSDEEYKSLVVNNCYERISQNYSWANAAQKIENIIQID